MCCIVEMVRNLCVRQEILGSTPTWHKKIRVTGTLLSGTKEGWQPGQIKIFVVVYTATVLVYAYAGQICMHTISFGIY